MSTQEGLNALEHVLRTNAVNLIAGEPDWIVFTRMCPWADTYMQKVTKRAGKNFDGMF